MSELLEEGEIYKVVWMVSSHEVLKPGYAALTATAAHQWRRCACPSMLCLLMNRVRLNATHLSSAATSPQICKHMCRGEAATSPQRCKYMYRGEDMCISALTGLH